MEESISTKKLLGVFTSVMLSTALFFAIGFLMFTDIRSETNSNATPAKIASDGTQLIELQAKAGFEPKLSSIQAGKAATLKIDTNQTFDCSSTVSIPKLGIHEVLPSTGTVQFTIPPQIAGTVIDGTCSMGMYPFKIVVQ